MTLNGRMTVATAVACVLTSTVLLPFFISIAVVRDRAGAVIAVAATGALTRLRTLPVSVCLAASLAGLLLYLNLIFEVRHSLLLVIPTPTSLSRLWHLAGTGVHDANRYAPPAPSLPGLLLLAAAGVGITAVLADLIAVRLRSTALAGLPLLRAVHRAGHHERPAQPAHHRAWCSAWAGWVTWPCSAPTGGNGSGSGAAWSRCGGRRSGTAGPATRSPRAGRLRRTGAEAAAGAASGPGYPGAGRRGPAGRARLHRAGPVRAADRARPAREQAVLLRPRHRRHGRHRRRSVAGAAQRPGPGRRAAAREPAAHDVHVHDRRHRRPSRSTTRSTSGSTCSTRWPTTGWQVTTMPPARYRSADARARRGSPAPRHPSWSDHRYPGRTSPARGRSRSSCRCPTRPPGHRPGKWLADPELMVYSTSGAIAGQLHGVQPDRGPEPGPAGGAARLARTPS